MSANPPHQNARDWTEDVKCCYSFAVEDEDMTNWLLDHGADPNRQSLIEVTPLSFAVEDASIRVINLMLDRGGDIQKGKLLHRAVCRKSENIEVLQLLIDRGAPLNMTMFENDPCSYALYYFMGLGTALHKAAELGKVDVVRYLLSQGADTTVKDANGRTALELAERLKKMEVVEVLKSAQ